MGLYLTNAVHHWKFESNANDNIGTNHGTVTGATLAGSAGPNNSGSYYFDGINDDIDVGILQMPAIYTFSMWFKPNYIETVSGKYMYIFANKDAYLSDPSNKFEIRIYPYYGYVNFYYYDSTSVYAIGRIINNINDYTNTWNHIANVVDTTSNVHYGYLNGVLIYSYTTSSDIAPQGTPTYNSKFGFTSVSNSKNIRYSGSIGETVIYNVALSSSQIREIFKEYSEYKVACNPTNKAWYVPCIINT